MGKRWLAAVAAVGVALAACGGGGGERGGAGAGGGEDGEPDPNGVARLAYDLVASSRGGITMDPLRNTASVADNAIYHWVYGALVRPTAEGELVPDLAESATVVDSRTIELVIREGLTLSDGTPFDAGTVKAGLERNLAATDAPGFRRGFFSLESVELTSDATLTLHIPDGSAVSWYEQYLPGMETVIVPEGTDVEAPVGAGPFRLTEWVDGESMTFEKNPEYWDADAIRLAGIELVNAPPATPQAPVSALSSGQVDWARFDYSVIDAAGPDLTVVAEPDPGMLLQFLMCKSEPPLDDVRVRRALSHAVDRDAINEALFDGNGAPAWDFFPEGHPLHNEELTGHYAYDPDRARELLREAGHEDGFEVSLTPIAAGGVPEAAQIVQQQWEDIGVTMNIVNSSNFVEDFMINTRTEMGGIPQSGDGRGVLDNVHGDNTRNICRYEDPELTELVDRLQGVSDASEEGAEVWAGIQEVTTGDALSIYLVFQPLVHGYDDARLGDVGLVDYGLPLPDVWELYVEAG